MHPKKKRRLFYTNVQQFTQLCREYVARPTCRPGLANTMADWGPSPMRETAAEAATHDPQADLREAGEGTMQSRWHAQRFRLFRHVCKTILQIRDGLNGWTLRSLLLRRQCPGGKTPRNEEKVWHVMTRQKKVVRRKEEDEDGFRHLCYNYFIQVYNYLSAWV